MLPSYHFANIAGPNLVANLRQRPEGEKHNLKVVDLADAYECLREYATKWNEWGANVHDEHVSSESGMLASPPYCLYRSHNGVRNNVLMQDSVWDLLYNGFYFRAFIIPTKLAVGSFAFPFVQKSGYQSDSSWSAFWPGLYVDPRSDHYTVTDEFGDGHLMLCGVEQDSQTSHAFGAGCPILSTDFVSRVYSATDRVKHFAVEDLTLWAEPGTVWDGSTITTPTAWFPFVYQDSPSGVRQIQSSKASISDLSRSTDTAASAVGCLMFRCDRTRFPSTGGTEHDYLYSVDAWDLTRKDGRWWLPDGSIDGSSISGYLLQKTSDTDIINLTVERAMVVPSYDWRVEL